MISLTLRPMALGDIGQVYQIERQVFSSPWTARTYTYEITESEYSYMMVLTIPQPSERRDLWARVRRLIGQPFPDEQTIVAYGGLWHLNDEAHISTIASSPVYRRKGYGELALVAMIQRAVTLDAAYVALEVRVSNNSAQALYLKHGFQVMGIKPRYYSDNGENAYDMRLPLTEGNRQRATETFYALCEQMSVSDSYTDA